MMIEVINRGGQTTTTLAPFPVNDRNCWPSLQWLRFGCDGGDQMDDRAFSYYELSMRKRAVGTWEWEVKSPSGRLLMHGQHRSRNTARYYGYRSLLQLLGAPPRPQFSNPSK